MAILTYKDLYLLVSTFFFTILTFNFTMYRYSLNSNNNNSNMYCNICNQKKCIEVTVYSVCCTYKVVYSFYITIGLYADESIF